MARQQNMTDIENKLAAVLSQAGYDIVLLEYIAHGKILRLYIDHLNADTAAESMAHAAADTIAADNSGITLEDCSAVSTLVSDILDGEDLMAAYNGYSLEVSSPGIERPLHRPKDFARFLGKKARIRTRKPIAAGANKRLDGVLQAADAAQVTLSCAENTFVVPLADIERAHLLFDG